MIKPKNKEFFDITDTILTYAKYWKWILLSAVVCVALGYIYLKVTPPVYNTSANILIKPEDSKSGGGMSSSMAKSLGFGGLASSENIQDEVNIISSYTLLRRMSYDMGLYKNYTLRKFPFNKSLYNDSYLKVDVAPTLIDTLINTITLEMELKNKVLNVEVEVAKETIGEYQLQTFPGEIKTPVGTFKISLDEKYKPKGDDAYKLKVNISGLDASAELMDQRIKASPIDKKSNIIGLGIEDISKERSKNILNHLIELYNIDAMDDKNKMAQNTVDFINERINYISKDLTQSEVEIENFKKENKLTNIDAEAGAYMSEMRSIKEKFFTFELQLSMISMLEDYLDDPSKKYALIPLTSGMPGSIIDAVQNYNLAIIERTQMLQTQKETNPSFISINNQINLLKGNMKTSIQSARKEINIAKKDWGKQESAIESKSENIPAKEREYLGIKRQQILQSELYMSLLQKLQEAELTLASNTPKAKIINAAFSATEPVAPKRGTILIISFIIGMLIPIMGIYVRQTLKVKLSDLPDLSNATNIPILGEVCKDKSGERIVVSSTSTSSTTELIRLIRANLQFLLTNKNEKVILVTSSISGEGKSFIATNLAISLSLIKNKKVALVGLDIRKPKLSEYLSQKNDKGVTTFLSSDTYSLEDMMINLPNLNPSLYFIPAGPVPPNPSELLLSDRLDDLFEQLRKEFDYIIVDTAPVGLVSDTFALARVSDATIFVYRADYTNKSHLKALATIVEENKFKKVSLVMNGTTTKSGYGYGYAEK